MLEKIKQMLLTFSYVTTGVIFAEAIFITVFLPDTLFTVSMLWETVGTSFICVLGNLFYHSKYELSKKQIIVRMVLHYIYINIVVFGVGNVFQWRIVDSIQMILLMIFLIAVVFIAVSVIMWTGSKKTSELLNRQLKEYQES
ncbi:MAG: DUF3021 family protein [Lachnospiraceae bacterium]|nr:DUF3021 family protein [Lachnospiraceae bacterium]